MAPHEFIKRVAKDVDREKGVDYEDWTEEETQLMLRAIEQCGDDVRVSSFCLLATSSLASSPLARDFIIRVIITSVINANLCVFAMDVRNEEGTCTLLRACGNNQEIQCLNPKP